MQHAQQHKSALKNVSSLSPNTFTIQWQDSGGNYMSNQTITLPQNLYVPVTVPSLNPANIKVFWNGKNDFSVFSNQMPISANKTYTINGNTQSLSMQ